MINRFAGSLAFNAIWFQSIWFCTVLGREQFLPLTIGLLLLHIWLVHDYRVELRQLAVVGGIGIMADAVLSAVGVFEFSGSVLVPLWLCCLWLAFAALFIAAFAVFVWLGTRSELRLDAEYAGRHVQKPELCGLHGIGDKGFQQF